MATARPIYFPSLYDKGVFDSPESHFDMWMRQGMAFPPSSNPHRGEVSRWPPGLADLSYIPIWFFSTHFQEDLRPRTGVHDKLCELEIHIKEIELLSITGDWYDVHKYYFLTAVREKMIHDVKAAQAHGKPTQASSRRKLF